MAKFLFYFSVVACVLLFKILFNLCALGFWYAIILSKESENIYKCLKMTKENLF